MATAGVLTERIDAEFSAAQERWDRLRTQHVRHFEEKTQRLEQFERTVEDLRPAWGPRLDALAKKFGNNMKACPTVEVGRRVATLEFRSDLARITLRLAALPDADVRKLILTYDVEILPILMKFDSHHELELPLEAVDSDKVAQWLDDRLVEFVQTYLSLHENPYYLQDHLVEDPIAKVRFPKFAAAAKLESNGKTFYFIDESTLREFENRNNQATTVVKDSEAAGKDGK